MDTRYLAGLALLLLSGCCSFDRTAVNVPYGPDPANTFDVYTPEHGSGPWPAILAIHGGAWQSGDKSWGESVAEEIGCGRYVVVSINYRLAPTHRWPAQIEDAQLALNYVRAHAADYDIKPDKIGVMGHSAGGQLAAMLAARPNPGGDKPVAAVCASGEGDLRVHGTEPIMGGEIQVLEAVLGPQPFAAADLADMSPVAFIDGSTSPTWVIHATHDQNVYFTQAERLHDALQAAGVPTGFSVVHDDCHSSCWKDWAPLADIRAFFAQHLGG